MKKIIVMMLMFAITFAIAGCGKKVAEEKSESEPVSIASTEAVTIEEPETDPVGEDDLYVEEMVVEEQPDPLAGYQLLYEYNGAKIYYTPIANLNEKGDLTIDLRIDATESDENVAVSLSDCSVNGFEVSVPSRFMNPAGNEIETTLSIWTSALSTYGLKNFSDVKTGFSIYTFDADTYDVILPEVAVIDPVVIDTEASSPDTEVSGLDDPIYDSEGVKIYSIQSEEEFFSNLNILIVNETGKDIRVIPSELEMNGEKQDVDYSPYAISVSADKSAFGVLPLPNYEVDDKTWETKKIEVTSYKVNFTIE